MMLIKLTAEDVRLVRGAQTDSEARGVVQRVKELILQTETLNSFGKTPKLRAAGYGWRAAYTTMCEVLGEDKVTKPPFPDSTWFITINNAMARYKMGEPEVRALAEYVRDHLGGSNSFDFLIRQHHRILTGEFDRKGPGAKKVAGPDLSLHQLPEE